MLIRTGLVALALLTAAPLAAQTVEIGPNGPSVDFRSQRQRERDIDREQARRDDREQARREARRDREYTGSTRRVQDDGCRTTTTRYRDEDGVMRTRRTSDC